MAGRHGTLWQAHDGKGQTNCREQRNHHRRKSQVWERMTNFSLLRAIVLKSLMPLPAAAILHPSEAVAELGRALYVEHCAACHGGNLEGQPDWRIPDENGLYPAPPHDETGHTWHHDDAMLLEYISRGGQAVLDDMGVKFTSGMPGFGSILTDREIEAILDYIKSTWPQRIRAAQAQR
jgi:mono/diheme cytochrome c family protein